MAKKPAQYPTFTILKKQSKTGDRALQSGVCWFGLQATWGHGPNFYFLGVDKTNQYIPSEDEEGGTSEASDIIKTKSSHVDFRATGGLFCNLLRPRLNKHWLMIAFIIWNSNAVPLLEGRCTSNPCRFEFSVFWIFAGIEPTTSGLTVPHSDQLS